MKPQLSEKFARRMVGAFGQAGELWLGNLPRLLKEVTDRWSLNLLSPFEPLSYHFVAPAIGSDGERFVLKAGVPNREFANEINSLDHFDGQGMVRLFKADYEAGVMLLEHITPGTPLAAIHDDERATSVFSEVMRRMRKAAPDKYDFPTVSDWAQGFRRLKNRFEGSTGPLPERLIDRADALMSELIASMTDPIVLHGDLHHWNILSAEREPWLALDPQGVIGEQEYEVGAWLRNPFPQILEIPNPRDFMARRVDQLVDELGFERYRINGWAFGQAVLAAVWSFEDDTGNWDDEMTWAEQLDGLL